MEIEIRTLSKIIRNLPRSDRWEGTEFRVPVHTKGRDIEIIFIKTNPNDYYAWALKI